MPFSNAERTFIQSAMGTIINDYQDRVFRGAQRANPGFNRSQYAVGNNQEIVLGLLLDTQHLCRLVSVDYLYLESQARIRMRQEMADIDSEIRRSREGSQPTPVRYIQTNPPRARTTRG